MLPVCWPSRKGDLLLGFPSSSPLSCWAPPLIYSGNPLRCRQLSPFTDEKLELKEPRWLCRDLRASRAGARTRTWACWVVGAPLLPSPGPRWTHQGRGVQLNLSCLQDKRGEPGTHPVWVPTRAWLCGHLLREAVLTAPLVTPSFHPASYAFRAHMSLCHSTWHRMNHTDICLSAETHEACSAQDNVPGTRMGTVSE